MERSITLDQLAHMLAPILIRRKARKAETEGDKHAKRNNDQETD